MLARCQRVRARRQQQLGTLGADGQVITVRAEALSSAKETLSSMVEEANHEAHVRHYMTQPLVEMYGGCMVVLKIS